VIDQEPLESSGHVPAVLEHPYPIVRELPRPGEQRAEPGLHRLLGPGRELFADLVDGHRRVRPLVRIDPDRHHNLVPSVVWLEADRWRTCLSWGYAKLLSRSLPAGS
jgi:hypothetical protein